MAERPLQAMLTSGFKIIVSDALPVEITLPVSSLETRKEIRIPTGRFSHCIHEKETRTMFVSKELNGQILKEIEEEHSWLREA